MSKFVDQIIKGISDNPLTFRDYNGEGVIRNQIKISRYGNTAILSIIKVEINGKTMPTTYIDKFRLEGAIRKWYKNIPLSVLLGVTDVKQSSYANYTGYTGPSISRYTGSTGRGVTIYTGLK